LLTPGFITDIVGFLMLTPPVRKYIINRITLYGTDRFVSNVTQSKYSFQTSWGNNTNTNTRKPSGFSGGITIEAKATESILRPAANQDQHDPSEPEDSSELNNDTSNKTPDEKDNLVIIQKPKDPPEDS